MALTELEKIAERVKARDAVNAKDRARQRQLIRQRIREDGHTWSQVEAEARVSRATIRDALNRED
jgi:hypothetical protein